MSESGHNPMRWDCKEKGCFNWKLRPKIEVFSDCFPGRINFGDIDGIVEIQGNALLLEWKGEPMEIPQGQRIMYQRLTADGMITAIMLAGDARTMSVSHRRVARKGEIREWELCDLASAQEYMRRWCAWAQKYSRVVKPRLKAVEGAA